MENKRTKKENGKGYKKDDNNHKIEDKKNAKRTQNRKWKKGKETAK